MNPLSFFGKLTRRKIIALVIVGALIAVVLGSYAADLTGWNTTGAQGHANGWDWEVTFSDTNYVTSWKEGGVSETIVCYFKARDEGSWTHVIDWIQYKIYLEGTLVKDSGVIHTPVYDNVFTTQKDWRDAPSYQFTLSGPVTGRLKVETSVNMNWDVFGANGDAGTYTEGWDGAYAKSGKAQIYLVGDQGPFAVGETARVFVKTGYTKGEGWTLKAYPPADRSDLTTVTVKSRIADDTESYCDFPIKDGYFKAGSTNEWKLELWNDYFDVGFTQVFCVDDRAKAPERPTLTLDLGEKTASVTAVALSTYHPITSFKVWAWHGSFTMPSVSDSESWILYGTSVTAHSPDGKNYTAVFTVDPKDNVDGAVQIKVVAYDDEGRASSATWAQLKVEDGKIIDKGGDDPSNVFVWSNVVIVLLLLGAVLAIIAAWLFPNPRIMVKVGVALVVFALFAVGAYICGTTPSLMWALG